MAETTFSATAQALAPTPTPAAAPAPTAAPVSASTVVSVRAEAAPVVSAPARAAPFVLPLSDLQALAAQAGLEWVGSDADKVAAAQTAIAAEPKAIQLPRQPRPPAVVNEGPLVLVETRKDLSQLKLPFDHTPAN